MDNKLIRQFGEDILCYRIRTERQKKRAQHKAFEKHLLRLDRESRELRHQQWNLGYEPLIPPVQKGWKRFFALREDVARSKDADFFAGILAKINNTVWHSRKDFKVRKRLMGRKKYVVKPQKLFEPCSRQFAKLDLTEAQKAFFIAELRFEGRDLVPEVYFVFKEPWRFVLRVRPHMVDKIKVIDTVIEARLKEIENYIRRNNYERLQLRLLYGHDRWRWRDYEARERERNPLKNKPISRIIEEVKEEIYKE